MQTENQGARGREAASERHLPDDSPGFALAERCAWHLLEKKLEDVIVLDLRGNSDVCDFFVIASGGADTQVQAAARHTHDRLAATGHHAHSIEGLNEGRWVLLDFFDVVVHVFHQRTREYFQLERLWGDAPRLDLAPEWFAAAEVAARHPDLTFTNAAAGGGGRETGNHA
ncbi:MAG: ribosome silencing factor [bacterium]|nr:ribosome silencing factor [bacterium]